MPGDANTVLVRFSIKQPRQSELVRPDCCLILTVARTIVAWRSKGLKVPPLAVLAHPHLVHGGGDFLALEGRHQHLGADAQAHGAALGLAAHVVHLHAGPLPAALKAAEVALARDDGAKA